MHTYGTLGIISDTQLPDLVRWYLILVDGIRSSLHDTHYPDNNDLLAKMCICMRFCCQNMKIGSGYCNIVYFLLILNANMCTIML